MGNCTKGELINIVYLGTTSQYYVHLKSGEDMIVYQQNIEKAERRSFFVGEEVYLSWFPENTLIISP